MTERDRAQLRNRIARHALARDGEVLPEADRRGRAGRVGAVERCSPSQEQTRADAPLTATDLTPAERTVYDDLMAKIDVSIAAVDVAHHFACVARDAIRRRGGA